jgi:heptosyltransferase II
LINNGLKYFRKEISPVEEQFRVLEKAGVSTVNASKRLELWIKKEDFLYVENLLKEEWVGTDQLLVGLNAGGSWPTKRWPLRSFARLSDMLAAKDVRVVITGAKDEMCLAEKIINLSRAKIINAAGRTSITQLGALIKRCAVFVTGDSAPMHIASAVGADFLALFGPTDPKRHYEPSDGGVVLKKEMNCSPCYKAECKNMSCMEKISVEEVYKMVMERIGKIT